MNLGTDRTARILLAFALGLSVAAPALAQDRGGTQARNQDRQTIYGSQLMTDQERTEYRNRMRELRTAEERERFRAEHHDLMQARARERGLQLPPEPPRAQARPGPGGGSYGAGPGGPGVMGGPGGSGAGGGGRSR